jgi:riboflavin synthase
MFTGLIEDVGEVVDCERAPGGTRLRIGTSLASELTPGDSLAVNGVCLTVTLIESGRVLADVGPETLRVTTLGELKAGARVNLERPLRADGRFGGHFVQGHVDGMGRIEDMKLDRDCQWITISFPSPLTPYLVQKGSIAVDGVSLTVAMLGMDRFDVQLIPFTLEHTTLGTARIHDRVNLECDMVGKYVVRAAESAGLTLSAGQPAKVS